MPRAPSPAESSPTARADAIEVCAAGALTIKSASEFTGISRTVLYELITEGRLTPIRLGRRVLLPKVQLIAILANGIET